MILSRFAADGFSRPVIDTAELYDICVAQLYQLFGRLLAAVAAAAVYQDQLLLVWQLRDVFGADGFVRDIDGAGDMLCGRSVIISHFIDHPLQAEDFIQAP